MPTPKVRVPIVAKTNGISSTASGKEKLVAPFGSVIADSMAIAEFDEGHWAPWTIQPTAPLALHPAAHVLHYASSCFEGLKAYRCGDGANVFRLNAHVERMRQSAALLCLPFPGGDVLSDMILGLVSACREVIPAFPGSLYLRPTLIGTQANIGSAASPSTRATLYVIASPVGDYFEGGERPLRIFVEQDQPRTTPDFGLAKTGANYASALRHIAAARATHRADQVLFCPQGDVQETGASNFMLISEGAVLTKALDSSYLHGVTRDSILTIAGDLGYAVSERNFNVEEMVEWVQAGEAALSGTAAILAGVGTLVMKDKEILVNGGAIGDHTRRLRNALIEIQSAAGNDQHGWLTPV